MRNATISIAEINNGFLVTTAGQSQYGLIGGPPSNSVQFYSTMEELTTDAGRFISAAFEAAKQDEDQRHAAMSERAVMQRRSGDSNDAAAYD